MQVECAGLAGRDYATIASAASVDLRFAFNFDCASHL